MHSRAYLLLQKEYRQFRESELQGIIAVPLYENMMDWDVQMNGLLGTPWQGLFFRLTMNFTLEYNFVPPVVKFTIVPFHPNVHQTTGKPCIDFLDDLTKWKEGYTFSSILLTIQVMLSEPVLDNPVNLEAAQMLMLNRSMYMLINHKIFKEAVLSAKKKGKLDLTKLQFVPPKFTRKVSFNDYYMTWCRIATSKVDDHDRASLFEDPNFIGMYYKWKTAERNHPKEWNLKFLAALARFDRENKFSKPDYQVIRRHHSRLFLKMPTETLKKKKSCGEEIDEVDKLSAEVDHLLSWTKTLDEAILEED